ncbi:MAG: hypothetical protein IKP83_04455 [Bacteroidales bacterium]|nr:hypothetical protein [Bacteroidales bacterium]
MNKQIFMTMFAALMLCFAACGKDEENNTPDNPNNPNGPTPSGQVDQTLLPGTWLVDTMTINNVNHTPENFKLIFYADGTGLLNDNGVTENNEFTWVIQGTNITVTPRHGQSSYTILKLTATEAAFNGTDVEYPGGNGQTANVYMHMIKIEGGDNPPLGEFPVGTTWSASCQTTQTTTDTLDGGDTVNHTIVAEMALSLEFTNATDGNMTMEIVSTLYDGNPLPIPPSSVNYPFTYTYNSDSQQGVATVTVEGEGTMSMPFTYQASENTITVELPADAQEMFGTARLVFQRTR